MRRYFGSIFLGLVAFCTCTCLYAGTYLLRPSGQVKRHSTPPSYHPKKTHYTRQMNRCLSCTSTHYLPLKYPVMGDYVTVDRHKIWVEKYGTGKPTVILLNGGGETNRAWNAVIPMISRYTTVFAYDRQGLGRSQAIDLKPRTAKEIVDRLQKILQLAGAKPPYVLVGHSIGGLYLSYFARRFPHQVAGMVTVDADNKWQIYWNQLDVSQLKPGSAKILQAMTTPEKIKTDAMKKVTSALARKRLSPSDYAKSIENLEVAGKPASARQIEKLGKLPAVPLIALTEGKGDDYYYWHALIRQFSQSVPCGQFQVVAHSGHHIMIDQPVVVNDAIRRVVMAARAKKSLCAY